MLDDRLSVKMSITINLFFIRFYYIYIYCKHAIDNFRLQRSFLFVFNIYIYIYIYIKRIAANSFTLRRLSRLKQYIYIYMCVCVCVCVCVCARACVCVCVSVFAVDFRMLCKWYNIHEILYIYTNDEEREKIILIFSTEQNGRGCLVHSFLHSNWWRVKEVRLTSLKQSPVDKRYKKKSNQTKDQYHRIGYSSFSGSEPHPVRWR